VTTAWNTLKTARPDWLASGKVNILLQYGLSRHPELPDVPVAGEMGKTEADRQQLQVFMNAADVGYALMAAPETPEDRVAILRTAFDAMTRDAEFQQDAARIESGLAPLNGAKLEQLIKDTSAMSREVRDRALRTLTSD
jgi:tripartite-type tricarboxylate transporter receptor subunit TctC